MHIAQLELCPRPKWWRVFSCAKLAPMRIIAFLCLISFGAAAQPYDGDTLGRTTNLVGIDVPERTQFCRRSFYRYDRCYQCGVRAQRALAEVIKGREPKCSPAGDFQYCEAAGEDLSEKMLRIGWAVYHEPFLAGRLDLRPRYLSAQAEARKAGRGIWAGEFKLPALHRSGDILVCPN